ncbi:DAK2 domain-containing protein [Nocardioides sp. CFH 31398]|uniref:DAK2 domain-containing protein n=1 Tax=Nocardioides sp. CFH 31398 TaxID=2919579 RepID=UPI001F06B0CE|nr:DAK2 domain-containing protein [Nocardioides sp. CFH 31398]MCH1868648.1 DAK2 domain-containing protein [Nocardioides sp. CFH 31398]
MVSAGETSEVPALVRFLDEATEALAAAREEIDALNVYPVPDGDTGTNLYLTLSAARDAVRALPGADPDAPVREAPALGEVWATMARGALLGARGNSGVILSQMLGAVSATVARVLAEPAPEQDGVATARPGSVLARAMAAAVEASYAAVGEPVEGTILTVARAASEAATEAATTGGVRRVVADAAAAAREALSHTPEQLAVLAEAGVVDAGGRGLVVVLDAAEHVLTGRRPVSVPAPLAAHRIPVVGHPVPAASTAPRSPGTPPSEPSRSAYEVVYLLRAPDDAVPALRARLGALGDSLVVVGGDGLWKVHVHVDDAGAAVEAGLAAGTPSEIAITALPPAPGVERSGRRVVAVAAGPGLEGLFAEAGAVVVPGGPGRRPSAGMLLEAMDAGDVAEVVVLPNDADTVATAELAASTLRERGDVQVAVIPTRSQVQGLAALAVHEPARTLAADVLEMTATARHVRQGAVTVAARRGMTMAGPCEPGDVLGVIAGDFAVVGSDLATVARDVAERLLAGGGDLVTLVAGQEDAGTTAALAAYVEEHHPAVDVVVYDGGQDRYPVLLSVE